MTGNLIKTVFFHYLQEKQGVQTFTDLKNSHSKAEGIRDWVVYFFGTEEDITI